MKFAAAPCLLESAPQTSSTIPWWSDLSDAARDALQLTAPTTSTMLDNWDLVVVGAGIAGLSATLEAAKLGLSVLCLEAGAVIGLGATGRNAGILCAGINMPIARAPRDAASGRLWLQTAQALEATAALAKEPGSLLAVRQRGGLGLARSKTATTRLVQEAKARTIAGLNAHMLSKQDVDKMSDGRINTRDVLAAIRYPDEGSVQPLSLLAQMAREARQAGAKLCGQTHVVAAKERSGEGKIWQIKLADGTLINAAALIKAVGPTAAPSARIYALTFQIELPEHFPLFWDAAPYIYYDFRPGNGRLTTSGGRYGSVGVDAEQDKRYLDKMARATQDWLPELQGQSPNYSWGVDLEVASDLIPHLTPLGKTKKGLAIDGLGALGVMPGLVLGRQAAQRLVSQLTGRKVETF